MMTIETKKYKLKLGRKQVEVIQSFLQWYITSRMSYKDSELHITEVANVERAIKLSQKVRRKYIRMDDKTSLTLNLQEAATLTEVLDALHEQDLQALENATRYEIYDTLLTS